MSVDRTIGESRYTNKSQEQDWTAGDTRLDWTEEDEQGMGGSAVTAVAPDTAGPWGISAMTMTPEEASRREMAGKTSIYDNNWTPDYSTIAGRMEAADKGFTTTSGNKAQADLINNAGDFMKVLPNPLTGYTPNPLAPLPESKPMARTTTMSGASLGYPQSVQPPVSMPEIRSVIPAPTKPSAYNWGEDQPDNPVNPNPAPTPVSPLGSSWLNNGAPVNWLTPPSGLLAPTSMNIPAVTQRWNDPLTTTITDPTRWNPEPLDLATRIDARGGYTQANPAGYGASGDTLQGQVLREQQVINNQVPFARDAGANYERSGPARTPEAKKKVVVTPLKKNFWGSGGGGRGGGGGGGNWQAILGTMNWNI